MRPRVTITRLPYGFPREQRSGAGFVVIGCVLAVIAALIFF